MNETFNVADKDGKYMPSHFSGRERTYEECKALVDRLNKHGEFGPYQIISNIDEIFIKNGCVKDKYDPIYYHPNLVFDLYYHDGNLRISINLEYRIDKDKIPLTDENLKQLILAFNPKL